MVISGHGDQINWRTVRFWPKADIPTALTNVRFGSKSGHRRTFPYISATRRPECHKVAFNFAAVLVFLSGALSLMASYILLFSKKLRSEFAEKMQPDYKRVLRRALVALVMLQS
jgi:hypothetical protein